MTDLPKPPPSSEITPESAYADRRRFLKSSLLFAATAAGVGGGLVWLTGGARGRGQGPRAAPTPGAAGGELGALRPSPYSTDEPMSTYEQATTYNNFYELGLDKGDPSRLAGTLKPRPWTVAIDGEVHRPQTVDIDALLKWFPLEERVYRMRCVEALVDGDPVGRLPARRPARAASSRRRARATSRSRPCSTPCSCRASARGVLDWPYVEGLRLDEAMNPLAILAVGSLRPAAARPERRAAAPRRSVEVRVQGRQVDREDHA